MCIYIIIIIMHMTIILISASTSQGIKLKVVNVQLSWCLLIFFFVCFESNSGHSPSKSPLTASHIQQGGDPTT